MAQSTPRARPSGAGDSASAAADRRGVALYGEIIARDGIAPIPAPLYQHQARLGLDGRQVWFTTMVLAAKWDADLPVPSFPEMERCALLKERQLQRISAGLVAGGYLGIVPRFDPERGMQLTN